MAKDSEITFDLSTLTLGEAAEAERQSGWSIGEIVKSRTALRILGVFVDGLRTSERKRSWSEVSSLRILDVSPSTSREPKDSPSETSNV